MLKQNGPGKRTGFESKRAFVTYAYRLRKMYRAPKCVRQSLQTMWAYHWNRCVSFHRTVERNWMLSARLASTGLGILLSCNPIARHIQTNTRHKLKNSFIICYKWKVFTLSIQFFFYLYFHSYLYAHTMFTSEIASKLAIVKSMPTRKGSPN